MDDIRINKLGGIDNTMADSIARAKKVDLITLPKEVKGTNCGNCKWYKNITEKIGYCKHEDISQNVNQRMCCVKWTHHGEYRMFSHRLKEFE